MAPEGWEQVLLGDVAEVRLGATPARKTLEYWAANEVGGHPWVAISDLPDAKWIESTSERISTAGVENSSVKLVEPGHTLVSFKLTLGKVARAGIPLYTNEAIAALVPKGDRVDDDFLYYAIPRAIAAATSAARAVKGLTLNKGKLQRLSLLLPPVSEQKRIAVIVSSVDDTIAATRKVIEQTKHVRQGMLQTLMTRGIGHTSFKQTEIGEIPAGWDVATLGEIGKWTSGSTPSKSREEFWGGDVPWVTPKDMKVPKITSSEDMISEAAVADGARLLPPQTLLVVVRGMILAHTFPVAVTDLAVTINQDMKALLISDRLSELFVLAWLQLNESAILALVSEATHGTKRLPQTELLSFPIPIPPMSEQDAIVSVLSSPQNVIDHERRRIGILTRMKRGLQQDLLSGRVRVQSD